MFAIDRPPERINDQRIHPMGFLPKGFSNAGIHLSTSQHFQTLIHTFVQSVPRYFQQLFLKLYPKTTNFFVINRRALPGVGQRRL